MRIGSKKIGVHVPGMFYPQPRVGPKFYQNEMNWVVLGHLCAHIG